MYGNSPEETIIPSMEELGLDPALIKFILITHAGPDHVGGAAYFQENYGTRIIMSQQDWDGILNPQPGSWVLGHPPGVEVPMPERDWRGHPRWILLEVRGRY